MKTLSYLILLLSFSGLSQAAEQQLSRSAGKLQQDNSVDLSEVLRNSEVISRSVATESEDYASSAIAGRSAGIANRHDQIFEVFHADAFVHGDLDQDGYGHQVNVLFDADVSVDDATVYAKLYLSRDGYHWNHYFTTDLFHIVGNSSADEYEVNSELLEGYPPGHYSVLIELYSLDHAYMVASEVLDYYYLGKDLRIEDLSQDDPYYDYGYYDDGSYVETYSEVGFTVGGGSFSLLLFFLIIQVVIVARGILSLPPCKTIIRKGNP